MIMIELNWMNELNMNWIWNDKRMMRMRMITNLKIVWIDLWMICEWFDDDNDDRMIEAVLEKREMWTKKKWNSWMDSTLDYQITHTNECSFFDFQMIITWSLFVDSTDLLILIWMIWMWCFFLDLTDVIIWVIWLIWLSLFDSFYWSNSFHSIIGDKWR